MESGGLAVAVQPLGIPDAALLVLEGPLDARTVPGFKARVEGLFSRGTKRFIVDLAGVKYVNSTGIAYLINLSESLGEGRKAVTVVNPQPKVKIIFDTMGVTQFFRIVPGLDAAVRELKAETPAPPSAPLPVKEQPVSFPKPPAEPVSLEGPGRPKTVRREAPSTKTGRMSPPTTVAPIRTVGPVARFFRKLFGRK